MQKSITLFLKLLVIIYLFSLFPSFADPCDTPHWIFGEWKDYYEDANGNILWITFKGTNENGYTQTITLYFNSTTGNTQQDARDILSGGADTLVEFVWEVIHGQSFAIVCDVSI
jgi:hypothetical protein